MLACFESGDDPLFVLDVREADVHRVDVRVVDQGAIRLMNDDGLEFRRTLGISAGNCVEDCSVCRMHRGSHRATGHVAGADEPPPYGHEVVMSGVTGRAFFNADCSAASMMATTLRDCRARTDIGVLFLRWSTIEW